ncbi:uncharacterized protein V6R79_016153 [Siganus canaliculatus]
MSLSKPSEPPRTIKCSRCRHHGIIVAQKGHTKQCPYLKCECWKCFLITQRTRITALHRNLKRAQSKEKQPSSTGTDASVGTPDDTPYPPGGGADRRATSGVQPESRAAASAMCPLDLRVKPDSGGEKAAALEEQALPFAAREDGSSPPCNSSEYISEFGQTASLPVVPMPVRMPWCFSSCAWSDFPPNMQWLPPMPIGLHGDSLQGPPIFPCYPSGALYYPPPLQLGPISDFNLLLAPHPQSYLEQLTPVQHLQPPLSNMADKNEQK